MRICERREFEGKALKLRELKKLGGVVTGNAALSSGGATKAIERGFMTTIKIDLSDQQIVDLPGCAAALAARVRRRALESWFQKLAAAPEKAGNPTGAILVSMPGRRERSRKSERRANQSGSHAGVYVVYCSLQ